MIAPAIFIVGYGPGLANGVASLFAKHNYSVGLISRHPESHPAIPGLPSSRVATVAADALDPESLIAALDTLAEQLGPPSAVVYNAAGLSFGQKPLLKLSWQEMKTHLDLGPTAGLVVGQWAAAHLEGEKRSLLYTNGGLAHESVPTYAGLSASKAALLSLANNFNVELKPKGVAVTSFAIAGTIQDSDPKYNKTAIAKLYWEAHQAGTSGPREIRY